MNALLYEHEDGRMRVAIGPATFTAGDPAWHRGGPVEVEYAAAEPGDDDTPLVVASPADDKLAA